MTWHLFGMVLTHEGTYANNRGETRGVTSTLQKIIRNGEPYTTVSAEAIRYALREGWQAQGLSLNRTMVDHRSNVWQDREFQQWQNFVDDDALGYMNAGKDLSRRGIVEINRAISTRPWPGTIHQNFASSGSNPGVTSENPIPYAIEVHHTRYQYPFALTPEWLGRMGVERKNGENSSVADFEDLFETGEKIARVEHVLEGIQNLRRVGGNHTRYMTDYSPEVIVLRWTTDPAPRFFYCFEEGEYGDISLSSCLRQLRGDIEGGEVIIGSNIDLKPDERERLMENQVCVKDGIKEAIREILHRIRVSLEDGQDKVVAREKLRKRKGK